MNCTIDTVKEQIFSYRSSFSGGRPSSFSETYKFINNKLVLINETGFYFIDSTDAETGKDLYRDYEKVRKDTSLVYKKDNIIKYNYGEK